MKKFIATAAMLGVVSLSFGQGYVAFFNTSKSRVSTGGVLAGGPSGSYYFALLVAPTTQTTITTTADPTRNGWTFTGVIATNTGRSGRILGSTSTDGVGAMVPGYSASTTANFAVVGWSANLGTTWPQAQAWWANGQANGTVVGGTVAYFGISSVATNVPLGSGGLYNTVFQGIPGMNLSSYPITPLGISSFALLGTNLVINASNGVAGGTYTVLMSTDVRLPLSQWTPVATSVLSGSGDFAITATNAVSSGAPQQFFILQAH